MPPEPHHRGWEHATLVTGGAGLLALAATYGIGRQVYGLFVPEFRTEFGMSLDEVGFFAGAAQIGFLVMIPVAGWATSRFGALVPVVSGCVVLAAGAVLVAAAPGTAVLGIGLIAAGASAGGTWAPFSDAVAQQVPVDDHGRALALVNAGAPIGLMFASVVALAAGEHWRIAWAVFAGLGFAAAVANLRVLRSERAGGTTQRWGLRGLVGRRSARLFAVTSGISFASGVYFTFAPEAAQAGGLAGWIGPAMWAVLGAAGGAVGIFTGDVARRSPLWPAMAATLAAVAASLIMISLGAGSWVVVLGSAALFGIGFTAGFALIVIWSQHVFPERPAAGFTVVILFLAGGFALGPTLVGVLAEAFGRDTALLVAGVPALLAGGIAPARPDRWVGDV